jgi:hypothetical protein
MSPSQRQIPDLFVEKLALGELAAGDARTLEAHGRAAVEAPLGEIRRSNAKLLERLPPPAVAEEVRRRLARARREQQQRRSYARALWWAVPAFGVIVAVLAVVRDHAVRPAIWQPPQPGAERIKGLEPHLTVYRQRGAAAEKLADGQRVRPHDVIQLGYVAAARHFGVIVSIDGRGAVTLHAPVAETRGTALSGDGEALLPQAFELDEAPGFERVFFVTADHPIAVADVLAAAHRLAADPGQARTAPLPLAGDLAQASFVLVKETP